MKQVSIALIIAVLAVAMVSSLAVSNNAIARDEVNLKEGKVNVKSKNVDINIIGGEGKPGKPGKDGRDGVDGKDGLPGIQGLPGLPGKNGTDGKNGLNGTTLPEETINIINEVVALYKNGSLNVNICYFSGNSTAQECPPVPGNTTNPEPPVIVNPPVDNNTNTNQTDTEPPVIVVPPVDNSTDNSGNQTNPLPPVEPPIIDNNTNSTPTSNISTFSGFHIGSIK